VGATADSVAGGIAAASEHAPAFAVVDMRLGDGRGFDVVTALRRSRPASRIVMLTGYGNIATAVAAVKAGAIDYLPKPADADAVERALLAQEDSAPEPPLDPMSADRVRWEHIQRVFELCDRNVSETARRLKMHIAPCSASSPSMRRAAEDDPEPRRAHIMPQLQWVSKTVW
jgi:two-component system, response regulator RegA